MGRLSVALIAAVSAIALTQVAFAADLPVKAPAYKAPAAVAAAGDYYFWLDGMYDHVRLPAYGLGVHSAIFPGSRADSGQVQPFDPRLNGGGVRGAIGYVMPETRMKFEFGGSYVGAKGSSSGSASTTGGGAGLLMNGGGVNNGFNCAVGGVTCPTSSSLSTNYSAWQFNGKAAYDWKYGSVTLTPFLAVFGGNTRVGQTLSQSITQFLVGFGVINTAAYSANTTEQWRDIGARIGVDVSAPVTPALTIGIGGWVGGAARHTSLSGSDAAASSTPAIFSGNSTLSISDNKTVWLANAEAGIVYKFNQMWALRGFAGLNYDGSVPGIASPSWAGDLFTPTSRTAASINYAHETSYYAGGGVSVTW